MRGILWSQLRIGIVVSIVVTVTSLMVFFIDQVRDAIEDRYTLYFYTFTTQSLRPRAPVWLAGQPVGYVTGVQFEPLTRGSEERLRVELSLSTEVQRFIQEGSLAQVITAGFLGEAVVNIQPAPTLADALPEGGELPTLSELDAFEAARQFRIIADSLRPVVDRWGDVLRLVTTGPGTLPRLRGQPEEFESLREQLRLVSATFDDLGAAAQRLADIVTDEEVRLALGRISPRLVELRETWGRSEGTVGRFAADRALVEHLEGLSESVSRLSERLEGGRGTVGRLLYDEALATELVRTRELLAELKAEYGSS